ncbi:MAG: GGDEF domain-containing protein [Actinomycetota bacterium]|nr:GGDEF domain-containing protein [Actinomycetota bacterium]
MASSRSTTAELEPVDRGGHVLVRAPVDLSGSVHVLEVLQDGDDLRIQVADLRRMLLLTLGGALLLTVPAFYFLGGRALASALDEAVDRSTTDPLTGLANHRKFQEDIAASIDLARRHGRALTLALVDLDGFKTVNDTLGHREGDRVLAAVAMVLRDGRIGDVAYRIGGDEFAILLPETDLVGAQVALERVRARVESSVAGVTTSIGVAPLGVEAPDVETLVRLADAALYAAKRGGRNRVVVSDGTGTGFAGSVSVR